ncbi:hypothetical protein Tco_0299772 [Tanacetum coccineum]
MIIDKSWTCLGKHEKAFYTGLKKFVDDCKPLVDSAGNIRCPCKSCRLVLWVSIKHLSEHILKYGFDPSYKTWIHHGEPDLPQPPPVIDNTRQPQICDMTACLNDLNYIPLNNEQNEPTQRDIGETSNDPTQAKRNEFEELYASANEKLYPGCDYVTRLDFMEKFTYFKVKGTNESPILAQTCLTSGAHGFLHWTAQISEGHQTCTSKKTYINQQASFKASKLRSDPTTGTYDVERSGGHVPRRITVAEWG